MMFKALKHVRFSKTIGVFEPKEFQKIFAMEEKNATIYLDTHEPISLKLQINSDQLTEVVLHRVIVQVGIKLEYRNQNDTKKKSVEISCGRYLDGPLDPTSATTPQSLHVTSLLDSENDTSVGEMFSWVSNLPLGDSDLRTVATDILYSVSQMPEDTALP
jgi:hypothetical protein